jgi:hypothetical protein
MKHAIKDETAKFTLEAGTKLKLGRLEVELTKQTEVSVDQALSYDAVVENIYISGNGSANAEAVEYTETRDDGKTYRIYYGASGEKIEEEVVAKAEPAKAAAKETPTPTPTPAVPAKPTATAAKKPTPPVKK